MEINRKTKEINCTIKMKEEETIFQIKVDRKTQKFELVKTELNNFEQSDFILFLEGYISAIKKYKMDEFIDNYDLNYEED